MGVVIDVAEMDVLASKTNKMKKLPMFLVIAADSSFQVLVLNYKKLNDVSMNAFSEDAIVKEFAAKEQETTFNTFVVDFLIKSWRNVANFTNMSYKAMTWRDFDGKPKTPLRSKINEPKYPERKSPRSLQCHQTAQSRARKLDEHIVEKGSRLGLQKIYTIF